MLTDFEEFCTFDACVAHHPNRSMCSAFEMVAIICQENGGDVTGWREAIGCGTSISKYNCQLPAIHFNLPTIIFVLMKLLNR